MSANIQKVSLVDRGRVVNGGGGASVRSNIWTNDVICLSGDTSCNITNLNIKTTSAIDVYSQSVSGKTANITSVVITNGQAVVSFDPLTETTNIRLNIIDSDVPPEGSNWTEANACASGVTTTTITDSNILTTSIIKAYCENLSGTPVKIISIVATTGQAVLTFDALTEASNIKLLITNV